MDYSFLNDIPGAIPEGRPRMLELEAEQETSREHDALAAVELKLAGDVPIAPV